MCNLGSLNLHALSIVRLIVGNICLQCKIDQSLRKTLHKYIFTKWKLRLSVQYIDVVLAA